jgi:phthalate 4,5-cis-dihydrodiol dehydrogenase
MRDALRVGIAGLSTAATWALREASQLPYIRFTAAADLRADALDRFAEEFGAEVFDDVEAMCRSSNVDAVLVGTPPELRPEHVKIAARCGKHVIVEKPMALSVAEAEKMNEVAEQCGVQLLCGHTHYFDGPLQKMAEMVQGGTLGNLNMVNTLNFNEFIFRPNSAHDLALSHGILFNQTVHQVDLVRLIGGGMVRSLRATVGKWEPARPFESGYVCYLEFEDGTPATMVYAGSGFFDVAELVWGIGESGTPRNLEAGIRARNAFGAMDASTREQDLEAMKDKVRYGPAVPSAASHARWAGPASLAPPENHQPFFGLTIVSCERGDIRQSPDGLFVYSAQGKSEVRLPAAIGQRQLEFRELYEAVTNNRPVAHGGRWGQATLEVCLAMMESASERKEVRLAHQVPVEA